MVKALASGVRGFTHIFNAMSPLRARQPGVVGAALEDQRAWCGVIVDGCHVAPATLKLMLKCRPHDRIMLVTDAMSCVGSDAETFLLNGRLITVSDGGCRDSVGTLAGSCLDMAGAVRNMVKLVGLDLAEASQMASLNPATFLGLDHELGRIAPGYRANMVVLDENLIPLNTWVDGLDVENFTDGV